MSGHFIPLDGFSFYVDKQLPDGLFAGGNGNSNGNTCIPIGSVFTRVTKSRSEGKSPDVRTVDLGVVAQVSLTLEQVVIFRKEVDAIPGGWSAGIRLTGDGVETLADILRTAGTREQVYIRGDTETLAPASPLWSMTPEEIAAHRKANGPLKDYVAKDTAPPPHEIKLEKPSGFVARAFPASLFVLIAGLVCAVAAILYGVLTNG